MWSIFAKDLNNIPIPNDSQISIAGVDREFERQLDAKC